MSEPSVARAPAGRALAVLGLSLAGAFLVFRLTERWLGDRSPFLPFVVAVLVSAWTGGWLGGLAATLGAALLVWLAVAPAQSDTAFWLTTVGFIATGAFTSLVFERLIRSGESERMARALLEQEKQEREAAELSNRQRRSELDALMQAAPALVMVAHDPEATVITGNALATRVFGVPPGANLSYAADPVPPYVSCTVNGAVAGLDDLPLRAAARSGQAVQDAEIELEFGDGRALTLFGGAVPLRGHGGEVTGAVGAFVDITARKAAQKALLANERRFRALIDRGADVIVTCDEDGRFTFASPSVQSVTGYTVEEFTSLNTQRFWHSEDQPVWEETLADLRRTPGASLTLQSRYRHKDGSWRWFEGTYTSLWHEPAVRSLVANLRDVTARRRSETHTALLAAFASEISEHLDENALLMTACRRLAQHFETPYCAVVDLGAPGPRARWDSWPHGTQEHVGRALEELASSPNLRSNGGRTLVVHDVEATSDLSEQDRDCCRRAGIASFVAIPLQQRGDLGASLIVATATPHRWTAEDVSVLENLSTRTWYSVQQGRLLQQQLEARRAAESASVLKDEFVAVVSHELRTPLNAILGWAQVGMLDPSQRERALDTIARNARRQARLVDDLLDLARMVAGQDQLTLAPVDLADVAGAAIESVTPAAQEKQVSVDGRQLSPAVVFGDATRLQQVVWNLLSNAVKFTPAGGRVSLETEVIGTEGVLRVRDTGAGIEPAFLPHVFERFRQGEPSSARKRGGLGLGLAITRHLVEAHSGHVTAASDGPGQGATFTVRLPLAPIMAIPRRSSKTNLPALSSADLEGLFILVVDDEVDTRHYVEVALHQHGAEVLTAASSREALECLTRRAPDILLADIAMPGEDGITLIQTVRQLPAPLGADTRRRADGVRQRSRPRAGARRGLQPPPVEAARHPDARRGRAPPRRPTRPAR